jgi:hypothetical protein
MADDTLRLETAQTVLLSSRQETLLFRTLVGLDFAETDQVLMTTLERMAGWLLNLPAHAGPGSGTLLQAALQAGIAGLRGAGPKAQAPSRLARGLGAAVDCAARSLAALTVNAVRDAQVEPWGLFSGSLSGWSRTHRCLEVRCQFRAARPLEPWRGPLLAGRVLSGVTLAFLERHGAASFDALFAAVDAPAHPLHAEVRQAVQSLIARGIWTAGAAVTRVWCDSGRVHLLWPLAGQDLMKEIRLLSGSLPVPTLDGWLSTLGEAGIILPGTSAALIEQVVHPGLGRPVTAVYPAPFLHPLLLPVASARLA